jgi:hypothetical protein
MFEAVALFLEFCIKIHHQMLFATPKGLLFYDQLPMNLKEPWQHCARRSDKWKFFVASKYPKS